MKKGYLYFLTSGFGDNLLALPAALELEKRGPLAVVCPDGPQREFFSACLPAARLISSPKSLRSTLRLIKEGAGVSWWIYPIGACTKRVRLLHLSAPHVPAVAFTSLNSEKAWQAEIGIQRCLAPNFAQRAWKNNLRLLSQVGIQPSGGWDDYAEVLRSRLKIRPKVPGRLVIHAGSARYAGRIDRFRRWPVDRFFEVAVELLSARRVNEAVWLIGPEDGELVEPLTALLARSPLAEKMRIVNHQSFGSSLVEAGAFLSTADYMLSNDSGLAHLATLYDVPLTAVFSGLGEVGYTGENGRHTQVLFERTECFGCAMGISKPDAEKFQCGHAWACMEAITAERVHQAVVAHLDSLAVRR